MNLNSAVTDVTAFVDRQGASLSGEELHKLENFSAESVENQSSFLGGVFVRFKKLLQEKSLVAGFTNCLKRDAAWEDKPTYGAFWEDHRIFDDLSNYYGNQYRGSFIFNYLMGAFAVLVALVPVGFAFEHYFGHDAHYYELLFTAIELVVILAILFIYKIGANPHGHHHSKAIPGIRLNRRWHERWIEYRVLAERFRYMEILYPIGIDPQKDGAARQDELGEWVNAYFAMRLSEQKVKRTDDLAAYKARLLAIMKGQSDYHRKNAHRSEHIHHRLHDFATWMFYGTLAACASHFVWHNPILTLIGGVLPAVAAAMHGILASGEFSKMAEISEQMHKRIEKLLERLNNVSGDRNEVESIAKEFHNMVIGEAQGWRSIFRDKNVPLA